MNICVTRSGGWRHRSAARRNKQMNQPANPGHAKVQRRGQGRKHEKDGGQWNETDTIPYQAGNEHMVAPPGTDASGGSTRRNGGGVGGRRGIASPRSPPATVMRSGEVYWLAPDAREREQQVVVRAGSGPVHSFSLSLSPVGGWSPCQLDVIFKL
uniref:Uncharacterized protein n=1 Tax=Oryza sativa subsp. japonica TaxID=39947 RepID=Q6Z8C9_ORYSJ|nr:hypothetical protein [Oryza sativa Japonica Group]BAD07890.1 hypothetical protein [Oryza sativa Japonica Group]